jgi:hypothetical protein
MELNFQGANLGAALVHRLVRQSLIFTLIVAT